MPKVGLGSLSVECRRAPAPALDVNRVESEGELYQ